MNLETKNKISAEIIADSKNEHGQRITSFILTFPRIVLAEFNTHRMLSRNSASSRAIPFQKMLKMVKEDPFIPIKWMKEHTGMQGNQFFEDINDIEAREKIWLEAKNQAIYFATALDGGKTSKQICNRLLEPFLWHKVLVTGTEWENFFALRAHPAAEIHIAALAEKMLVAYNESTPRHLYDGDWHCPFIDKLDRKKVEEVTWKSVSSVINGKTPFEDTVIKISTARCARTSYLNFEGKDNYEDDINLYNKLFEMKHLSPFEHCARAMSEKEYNYYIQGKGYDDYGGTFSSNLTFDKEAKGWCGNFKGFIQLRKMLQGENQTDNRVIKK